MPREIAARSRADASRDSVGLSSFPGNRKATEIDLPLQGARRPPFGRVVGERLRRSPRARFLGSSADGTAVTVFVAIGARGFEYAAREIAHRCVVAVAEGADPGEFDFSDVTGDDPLLIVAVPQTPLALIERTAATLLRDGARRVLAEVGGQLVRYVAAEDAADP